MCVCMCVYSTDNQYQKGNIYAKKSLTTKVAVSCFFNVKCNEHKALTKNEKNNKTLNSKKNNYS